MKQMTSEQVLVHAPYGRDAALICQMLERAGIATSVRHTMEELCAGLEESAGAALISDEPLTQKNVLVLAAVLNAQPPWSDLPLIITTSGGDATSASRGRLDILKPLGNISLLERPLRIATLVSAVSAALRGRRRQYQLREYFLERDQLVKELERSNQELTQFAHIVSHDLQAPIRMVKSFAELLEKRYNGQWDSSGDKIISMIQDGASKMEALVRTLLNYAIVGQEPIIGTRVELKAVADSVLTILQPAIEELHAEVVHTDLPTVTGDQVQLQQLIQNLVGNALKYSDPNTIPRVQISAKRGETQWKVFVKDNGPGIPSEHLEDIFLPLKRLHGKDISGTGMGLAVCRKIVERHGGKIWAESEPGQGATFCFTLPAAPALDAVPADCLAL